MHTVNEIMTRRVDVLKPHSDLVEVARHMRRQGIGILPISDGRRVQGIVTKSDVVMRALAKDLDPKTTTASDVMTRDVDYCYEDEDIEDAVEQMRKRDVEHLLVLNRNRNLVGVVSLAHVARMTGRGILGRLRERFQAREETREEGGMGIQIPRLRWLAMNRGTRIGVLSAVLVTAGIILLRRRFGMNEIEERMGEREIRAA